MAQYRRPIIFLRMAYLPRETAPNDWCFPYKRVAKLRQGCLDTPLEHLPRSLRLMLQFSSSMAWWIKQYPLENLWIHPRDLTQNIWDLTQRVNLWSKLRINQKNLVMFQSGGSTKGIVTIPHYSARETPCVVGHRLAFGCFHRNDFTGHHPVLVCSTR